VPVYDGRQFLFVKLLILIKTVTDGWSLFGCVRRSWSASVSVPPLQKALTDFGHSFYGVNEMLPPIGRSKDPGIERGTNEKLRKRETVL